jgi:CheY-like chemotaxis protein
VPNRVLVADDDRAIRESLARALELEGYDVATVVDGVEALTRVRRDTFDALVDVMMPGACCAARRGRSPGSASRSCSGRPPRAGCSPAASPAASCG